MKNEIEIFDELILKSESSSEHLESILISYADIVAAGQVGFINNYFIAEEELRQGRAVLDRRRPLSVPPSLP